MDKSCTVYDRDYDKLSKLEYKKALVEVFGENNAHEISCFDLQGSQVHYEQEEGLSIVPKVN